MTPRKLSLAVALPLLLAVALLAACGGNGSETARGQLTDPRSVPTATPWVELPEVTILEPGMLTPSSSGGPTPRAGTPTPAVECGETYTVESGDDPGKIAVKCGVSVEDLLAANPTVTPTAMHVGDPLKIPR